MKSFSEPTQHILEVMFFMTNKIEYFMALVRENPACYYLAGRINYPSGEKKLFTLCGNESQELRKTMMKIGEDIAGLYDAQCSHIVFPAGIDAGHFTKLLREGKAKGPQSLFRSSRAEICQSELNN